jgi:hypothetical protein
VFSTASISARAVAICRLLPGHHTSKLRKKSGLRLFWVAQRFTAAITDLFFSTVSER